MGHLNVDINCDMGESFGNFHIGNDEAVFPFISSSNIACGFHAGDPLVMERTIRLALRHHVRIGAHPGYPDLAGFGRRKIQMGREELAAAIKYQVAAIKGVSESLGGKVAYVKPHGALYNTMTHDRSEAETVMDAIRDLDPHIYLMGLAGSQVEVLAQEKGIPFISEAFADRRYEADGTLMSRKKEGSVIHDPELAIKQVLSIILKEAVECGNGEVIAMKAQSFCIHGDNPSAIAILQGLDKAFQENQITKGGDRS